MTPENLTPRFLASLHYSDLTALDQVSRRAVKKCTAILNSARMSGPARTNVEIMRAGYEIDKTLIADEINNRCELIEFSIIAKML